MNECPFKFDLITGGPPGAPPGLPPMLPGKCTRVRKRRLFFDTQ